MSDFWINAGRAYAERQRAAEVQAAAESLRPNYPMLGGSTASWVEVRRAKNERNRAASAGMSYLNLYHVRVASHEYAVQRYLNTGWRTSRGGLTAVEQNPDQAAAWRAERPAAAYSDVW
ncbi:hypothetical protein [Streptomyces sp. NPDC094032]|uniref:hypothetical protein n=1 Tax=Streptomyces sp. NPDC094032 TaxID=3155308 RepID=UPI00332F53C3